MISVNPNTRHAQATPHRYTAHHMPPHMSTTQVHGTPHAYTTHVHHTGTLHYPPHTSIPYHTHTHSKQIIP